MTFLSMIPVAAVALIAFASPSFAATAVSEANCTAWLKKADKDSNGTINGAEASAYLAKMEGVGVKPMDAKSVSKAEFMMECQKGTFEGVKES